MGLALLLALTPHIKSQRTLAQISASRLQSTVSRKVN